MKKIILISILSLLFSMANAQQNNQNRNEKRAQIEAQKIAYITTELNLTPEEAKVFWPVYDEYNEKLKSVESKITGRFSEQKPPNFMTMSDEELDQFMKDHLQQEQDLVNIRLEYYEKFKEVLSIRKVFALQKAEMDFRKKLMEHLRGRYGKSGGEKGQNKK